MKKKQVILSKKLFLYKSPVAALSTEQQDQLKGGVTGTICPGGTKAISECRATSPRPGQLCCQIW
ncbi:class I lanthipeptide [Chitinophaga nivalis]|uniref:Class I lanthipeptide n=1 Tax=Chitinophaga nivalis TaxID=2991709 RepID=A0ABT3ILA5_9BACT|nr:class I lanthipeptide [Chitinophaga nivalis]MCW3465566.1 class I lanthipeptide [Chitinophaga nivalis]MCW3484743.1 class I lanthipeptide [Chitinophaga nivalis]